MGLLDDAIREHLELKRRRGADAEEVTRQEHEALGPPQRAEFAEATPAPDDAPAAVQDPSTEEPAPADEDEGPAAVAAPPAEEPRDEGWLEDEPEPEIVVDQPTVEYAPEPPAEGEEDVLEETPDFLQETPEHDRLWFEQKPPRDFDFD